MPTRGLREQKKIATAHDLAEAAFALAAERGFDAVTVDDIVERAGYSRRTFANYFDGKPEAVVAGYLEASGIRAALERPLPATVAQLVDATERLVLDVFSGAALGSTRAFAHMVRTHRVLAPYVAHALQDGHDPVRCAPIEGADPVDLAVFFAAVASAMAVLTEAVVTDEDVPPAPDLPLGPAVRAAVRGVHPEQTEEQRIARLVSQVFDRLRHGFVPPAD